MTLPPLGDKIHVSNNNDRSRRRQREWTGSKMEKEVEEIDRYGEDTYCRSEQKKCSKVVISTLQKNRN